MSGDGTALVWFRRDLRLADNPALTVALERHRNVVPVYVHDPDSEGRGAAGAASRWWLHHSLVALDADLRRLGSRLQVVAAAADGTVPRLARALGAGHVYWNRVYEPAVLRRDARVVEELAATGVGAEHYPGALLAEPESIHNGAGEPYRVFTPFWKAHRAQARPAALLDPPQRMPAPSPLPGARDFGDLGLLPRVPWYRGFEAVWSPGERGALQALADFDGAAVRRYGEERDRPDRVATSRLSPHLHFGEVSPARVAAAVRGAAGEAAAPFLRQLVWRDFAHHLLHHFPETVSEPFNPRFAAFPWRRRAPRQLERWQRGDTGVPLVDAAMRELWETGWMHNRTRMVVASFLTKNLLMHWREGERWFHDTLVDADLANNVMGWQWTAGSGADAAPYFRVFNPVRQGQRFDPHGTYVRRWVPELAALPDGHIHAPWEAPATVLEEAGVRLGHDYPEPMVDLRESRERALGAYEEVKGGG